MVTTTEISVIVHRKEDVEIKTKGTTTELTFTDGHNQGLTTISIIMPNCVKEWLIAEMIRQAMERDTGHEVATVRIRGVIKCK